MTRLALLAAILAGCTTVESSDVLTSGIYASIVAEGRGDGTTDVTATLFVGNPVGLDYVELTGDDKLLVRAPGITKEMRETELLNTVGHHAEIAVDAEGTQIEVAFERTIDGGAPHSTATLPAKFAITGSPQTAARTQPITVTWGPTSNDGMSWTATGDCIEVETDVMPDTGTVTIDSGLLKKRMGTNVPDQCEVTITIARARLGMLDPGYGKGGEIRGMQTRTVKVISTP